MDMLMAIDKIRNPAGYPHKFRKLPMQTFPNFFKGELRNSRTGKPVSQWMIETTEIMRQVKMQTRVDVIPVFGQFSPVLLP